MGKKTDHCRTWSAAGTSIRGSQPAHECKHAASTCRGELHNCAWTQEGPFYEAWPMCVLVTIVHLHLCHPMLVQSNGWRHFSARGLMCQSQAPRPQHRSAQADHHGGGQRGWWVGKLNTSRQMPAAQAFPGLEGSLTTTFS